jgi:beta-lactamase regulating signal transducer with metallopeptidase domain
MDDIFVFAAHNTVVALVFALFVYGLTRVWRNPPVAHLLWLLVLLKLVAPPVMRVDWSAFELPGSTHGRGPMIADVSPVEGQKAEGHLRFADRPTARTTTPVSAPNVKEPVFAAGIRRFWSRGRPVLLWLWIGGAALCALFAAARIVRFERLLRDTLPASGRLHRLAIEIAGRLGVRRVPDVRFVECVEVPLLWCAGWRTTIVLPMRLLGQLDEQVLALILAHELAHLRRRDHWVRAVELIVSTLYWWNPLVWVIRPQIHQAEDLCCDAWVRWAFPDCTRRYAEVVLKTAELLGASRVGARLLPASPFLHSLSLKARIEMILESRFAPRVSARSMVVIALVAFLVLPLFVEIPKTQARAGSNEEARATPCDTTFLAERFKYRVPFEIGRTQSRDGGRIEISEVWGTRPEIEIGGQYLVRGKYRLPPGKRGMLYFYRTASGPSGQTASLDLQSTPADKQEGEFALVHGMAGPGYFHLILTDAKRYSRWFANVYFGTGDNVYRVAPTSTGASNIENANLPHAVRFEQGATRFLDGDQITILEVRGTAETFAPGNIYWIKGTYKLASHDRATLAAYTTAMDAENGRSASLKVQTTIVNRGNGTFTLFLPMSYRGWPHVSFYPADGGEGFGGNYFGTGDSVLKRWWGSKETD